MSHVTSNLLDIVTLSIARHWISFIHLQSSFRCLQQEQDEICLSKQIYEKYSKLAEIWPKYLKNRKSMFTVCQYEVTNQLFKAASSMEIALKASWLNIVVTRYKNHMHSICRFSRTFLQQGDIFDPLPQMPLTWDMLAN